MSGPLEQWEGLCGSARSAFTRPSFTLFCDLIRGWVLCPMRRTVTGMIRLADPDGTHAHDAYHRLLRAGRWSMTVVWKTIAQAAVAALSRTGPLTVDVDDTLFHKTGPNVDGAGNFRDPIRSSSRRVAYTLGLNLVVVTLRITPPWGGEPLGLPVNMRLHRKHAQTTIELSGQMLTEIAGWFPGRTIQVCGDGAYATLAGANLPRTHVTSRMRRDAALYEPAPPRTGKPGRPRRRGARLDCPEQLAATVSKRHFKKTDVDVRGRTVQRLLYARPVLWYTVCPDRLVLLVIVRDPKRHQPDDFFFTTDLDATPAWVAGHYAGRWSIEDTFRNTKQLLGAQQPQSWAKQGPERAAALSLWIYTAVWTWYVSVHGTTLTWPTLDWYTSKKTPSFTDALAALRRTLWHDRVFGASGPRTLTPKIADTLIDALALAA